jgi:hypothetical protein
MLASDRQVRLVAGDARIGRRPRGRADDEREGVESRWIQRCIPGCGYSLRRSSGKAFVDVQCHPPMLGCRKQGIDKVFLLVLPEQRGGNPGRLVAVKYLTRLPKSACPEDVGFRRAWPVVGEYKSGGFFEKFRVPIFEPAEL